MPQCSKCHQFLPPDFIDEVKDPTNPNMPGQKVCHYCQRNTTTIVASDGRVYTKEDVIEDYRQFVANLAKNKNIRKKMNFLNQTTFYKK